MFLKSTLAMLWDSGECVCLVNAYCVHSKYIRSDFKGKLKKNDNELIEVLGSREKNHQKRSYYDINLKYTTLVLARFKKPKSDTIKGNS